MTLSFTSIVQFFETVKNDYESLLIVGFYLLSTLVVGVIFGRKTQTVKDFCISRRGFATPIIVTTIVSTLIGGGSTLGLSEKVFRVGLAYIFTSLGSAVYKFIIAYLIAPRMGRFLGMLSVGEMMEKMYGLRGRVVTGICGMLMSVGVVGGQVCAIGQVCQYFLGWPKLWGITIGAGVVVIYTTFGGIAAVTITDFIQFAILIVAIPIICHTGLIKMGGSYEDLIAKIPQKNLQILPEGEAFYHIFFFLVFCIPFLNPAVTQRMLMAKDVQQIRSSFRTAAFIFIPITLLIGLIGLTALALYPDIDPQFAMPTIITDTLSPATTGLAIAGLLAVTMSTADSYLNVASVSFVHDVVAALRQKNKPLSNRTELILLRSMCLLLGGLSILMAIRYQSILDITRAALDFWGPIVVVPLLAGIFGFKTTPDVFTKGIIAAGISFLAWNQFLMPYFGVGGLFPSMVVHTLVFFLAHHLKKAKMSKGDDDGPEGPGAGPGGPSGDADSLGWQKESSINTEDEGDLPKRDFSGVGFSQRIKAFIWTPRRMLRRTRSYIGDFISPSSALGTMGLLINLLPLFIFSEALTAGNDPILRAMRILGSILCVIVMMKGSFPASIKRRLYPYLYAACAILSMPAAGTYLLLETQGGAWVSQITSFAYFSSVLPAISSACS